MEESTNNICKNAIIFFDGNCLLCSAAVQLVLRYDKANYFRFAALQSDIAQGLLKPFSHIQLSDSVLLIEDGILYQQSNAALQIASKLRWFWLLYYLFIWWPTFLRDPLYRFIAKNRYRWFGRSETCFVPDERLRHRFL